MEKVLPPQEINRLIAQISHSVSLQSLSVTEKKALEQLLTEFNQRWQTVYNRFAQNPKGELAYRDEILFFTEQILSKIRKYLSTDGADNQAATAIAQMLFSAPPAAKPRKISLQTLRQAQNLPESFTCPHFDRPLFIVSAPRAGSTLLFETLSQFAEMWSIGKESHDIEKDIPYLHPASHNYQSNRLTDAPEEVATAVTRWFTKQLHNNEKIAYLRLENPPSSIRFLEKTPKNALRIMFLKKIFPTARFIFLYRNPLENISSMLEGWRSNRFLAYRDLPGWQHKEWHFLLPPAWQTFANRPLAEIAAYQWQVANQTILTDLSQLPNHEWCFVTYQQLVAEPKQTIHRLSQFAQLHWSVEMEQKFLNPLPLSKMVVSAPSAQKWSKNKAEIDQVLTTVAPVAAQIELLNRNF